MKELDIKEIWNKSEKIYPNDHSQEVINKLLNHRPKSVVNQFIVMVKIELWSTVIVLAGLSIYLSMDSSWVWIPILNSFSVILYFYYSRLIKKLNIDLIDTDVVQYLNDVKTNINRFIGHYKVAIWIIVIPAFALGMYVQDNTAFSDNNLISLKFYIKWAIGLVAAITLGYVILYFWYGKRANKIREMLKSLESDEADLPD